MIRSVLVLGDPSRPAVRAAAARALPLFRRRLGSARAALGARPRIPRGRFDVAVVLGGDGAVLGAARLVAPLGIPLVGVNLGKLGFLTEVDLKGLGALARRLASGRYRVVETPMLACALERAGRSRAVGTALNDAVLGPGGISRLSVLGLRVDGARVATYPGDGLIVATPSGSTAHSLSAGGPILAPGVGAFAVTPIAPHTLSHRPLVVPASSRMRIRVEDARPPLALTLDGQLTVGLKRGDVVALSRAPHPCRFLLLREHSYYATLRAKLDWDRSPGSRRR